MRDSILPIEPESSVIVRFNDCDPFGHLNSTRYSEYLLNAREEHVVRHYPLLCTALESPQKNWVITYNQIIYLRPAVIREEVSIKSCLVEANETSGKVEIIMLNREATSLKAMMWLNIMYVDLRTGAPVRHSEELMAFFRSVVLRGAETRDFYQRVKKRLNELATCTGGGVVVAKN